MTSDKVTLSGVTYIITKRFIMYKMPKGPLFQSDDKELDLRKWEECKIESIDNNSGDKTGES